MKKGYKNSVGRGSVIILAALLCLAGAWQCKASQLALMLQQSPVDGGTIEPGNGVHKIERDTNITLRAVPQPGYQFVTWLGDVAEPTASVTTSYMDSPKIVIAVFERVQFDSLAAAAALFNSPVGGMRRSASNFWVGSGSGSGGKRPHHYYGPKWPDEELTDEIPVPETGMGDEIAVPSQEVPEPATVLLIGLGGLIAVRRRLRG